MHYQIFHLLFYIGLKLIFRYRVVGSENIPKRGPAILACNHASFLDPPIAATGLWRKVRFAARENLFNNRLAGWWLRGVQAFPISRETLDRKTLRVILKFLEQGDLVLLFPEGTRSWDGELQEGKPGVGMIAYLSRAPVIPACVNGTFTALPRGAKRLRCVPLSVRYGKPLSLGKYYHAKRYKGMYSDISREIMEAIRQLKEESTSGSRQPAPR